MHRKISLIIPIPILSVSIVAIGCAPEENNPGHLPTGETNEDIIKKNKELETLKEDVGGLIDQIGDTVFAENKLGTSPLTILDNPGYLSNIEFKNIFGFDLPSALKGVNYFSQYKLNNLEWTLHFSDDESTIKTEDILFNFGTNTFYLKNKWEAENPGLNPVDYGFNVYKTWPLTLTGTLSEEGEYQTYSQDFGLEIYGFRNSFLSYFEWVNKYKKTGKLDQFINYESNNDLASIADLDWFNDDKTFADLHLSYFNSKFFNWPIGYNDNINSIMNFSVLGKENEMANLPNFFALPNSTEFLNHNIFNKMKLPENFIINQNVSFFGSAFANSALSEGFEIKKGSHILEAKWKNEEGYLPDEIIKENETKYYDNNYLDQYQLWNLPENSVWIDENGEEVNFNDAISVEPNVYLGSDNLDLNSYLFEKNLKLIVKW